MKHRWPILALLILVSASWLWANLPSDFNNDGEIDFSDFLLFASNYGSAKGDESFNPLYDLDGNGRVEFNDYTIFAEQFGNGIHGDKRALTPDELEQAAKNYRKEDNYGEAVRKYKDMIALGNNSLIKARGIRGLGGVYVKMDSLNLAEEQFKLALNEYGESNDKSVQYQLMWCGLGLGMVKESQGSRLSALEYLNQARTYIP